MNFLKQSLFYTCISLSTFVVAAPHHEKFDVRGQVVDQTGQRLEFATIILNDGLLGAVCDLEGRFEIKHLPKGQYQYKVSLLGYDTKEGLLVVDKSIPDFVVRLHVANLEIDEVIVTAESKESGSTSMINKDAIRHIQPKNIEDILQLLPGGLTQNPTLNKLGQVSIREIDGDANNALGAAVIVDGMQLSNEANLQTTSFTKDYTSVGFGTYGSEGAQTTAGKGVDLRTVSVENVESVEVIRGIPSVEYGNLTSGIVIVNTKSGVSPLEVKAKVDQFSKLGYAGKGFAVGQGALNIGFDWSQSYADPRRKYQGYDRITANVGYSTVFNASGLVPIRFHLKSAYYSNINTVEDNDPQLAELQQTYTNLNTGGRFSVHGDALFNRWITKFEYKASAQVAKMTDETTQWVHSPDPVITNVQESGMYEARFNSKPYESRYHVDGLPVNIAAQVKANKYMQLREQDFTNFKFGVDYRYDVNMGDGLVYDIASPPQAAGSQRLRPRSYDAIPALNNLAAFVENDTRLSLGRTYLKTNIGLRFNHLFLDEAHCGQKAIQTLEPRMNLLYAVLEDQTSIISDLNFFGGYGISNKMPSLMNLYPDAAYFDYLNLAHVGPTPSASLAVMTTTVVKDTYNPDLKPMTSHKWEVGFNVKIKGVKAQLTYFKEHNENEFGYSAVLMINPQRLYQVPAGADHLRVENNGISYILDGEKQRATYQEKLYFDQWNRPNNARESMKHGVEYTLDLGQFRPLRTSLYIDGAWFYIKRKNLLDQQSFLIESSYPYAPIRPSGGGSIQQRLNTNFRFITHIPVVKLVFTTTFQVVWFEKYRSIYEDANGNERYELTSDGQFYGVAPLGFYDKQGDYHDWEARYKDDPVYSRMISRQQLFDYEEDLVRPWLLMNFRLTKEIGRVGEVSIMANNFMGQTHWHTNRHSTVRRQLLPPMYIGAELKLKF